MRSLHTITSNSRKGADIFLKGALFAPFNKSVKELPIHHLDTNLDDYNKLLSDVVIPDCMSIAADSKIYSQRVKEYMSHSVPSFTARWNFGTELTYRMVAPPEHQTKENLKKAQLLRIMVDIGFSSTGIIDDIADRSTMRRNKKTWQLLCTGGTRGAMYDGIVLSFFPLAILKKYFHQDPTYALLLEKYSEAQYKTFIGQTIDYLEQAQDLSLEGYTVFTKYKAGYLFGVNPVLGALHAGVTDEEVLNKMDKVFIAYGHLFQMWDDFQDYFSTPEKTGKPPNDFYNAGNSWVSTTAIQYFDQNQKKLFQECYGSSDPEKVETVKILYDQIDMPRKYIEGMRKAYLDISEIIETLPEQRFKDPLYSYMDWLIEDVRDPLYEKTKQKLGF